MEELIDTTAPDGDLVIRAVDATLQLQVAWIAEVTAEGQAAARARGQRLGSPLKLTLNKPTSHATCTPPATPPQHRRHAQCRNIDHLPLRTTALGDRYR